MVVGALLALPAVTGASHDPSGAPFGEDFVVGTSTERICEGTVCSTSVNRVDAHSGPSGQNPTGTTVIEIDGRVEGRTGDLPLSEWHPRDGRCGVERSRAVLPALRGGHCRLRGPRPSRGRQSTLLPGVCPSNPTGPIFDRAEPRLRRPHAVPVPTSKDQCKNGGWRNYPGFKNQGDCASFVATGGRTRRPARAAREDRGLAPRAATTDGVDVSERVVLGGLAGLGSVRASRWTR